MPEIIDQANELADRRLEMTIQNMRINHAAVSATHCLQTFRCRISQGGGLMNYSKLSDGEISVLVGRRVKSGYEVILHPNNPKGAQLLWGVHGRQCSYGFFSLTHPEDLFSTMKKYRIGIAPAGKKVWKATHESGLQVNNKNPLRAAAIVFLMLQDAMEAKTDKQGI